MIKLTDVSKSYGQFGAVSHLDLDVREGEIMGLIGHNGAGKSTTLKMVAGLIRPTSGQVEVLGRDMARHGINSVTIQQLPAPTRDAAAIPPAAGGERISVNIFEFRSSL
jgi:ABC-type multidrug transport system ATPase subunit